METSLQLEDAIESQTASQKFFAFMENDKNTHFDNTWLSHMPMLCKNASYRGLVYTRHYMWPLLDETSLNEIVTFIKSNGNKGLEICAGKGLFAALLKSYDVEVKATDSEKQAKVFIYRDNAIVECGKICEECSYLCNMSKECDKRENCNICSKVSDEFSEACVEVLDSVAAVQRYKTDILLCSWSESYALHSCLEYYKGKYIICIEEEEKDGREGCTETFDDCKDYSFTCIKRINIPQFFGMRDVCLIYERV